MHLLITCFPIIRPGACISNFLGSSPVEELDWDIDSRTPSDDPSHSMCLFGEDPVVLQQM